MDKPYIIHCREELRFIQKELEKAEKNNDLSQIEIQKKKRDDLLEVYGKNLDIYERSRSWSGKNLKLKNSISKSIHRAIHKIKEIEKSEGWSPEFSNHLRENLTPVSFPYSYSPDQPITWQT